LKSGERGNSPISVTMVKQENRAPNLDKASRDKTGKTALVSEAIATGLKSREFYRLYLLGLMLLYCGLFYYFGEIVDFFGWKSLRWEFFYSVHDTHRLLFLVPILYTAYVFNIRATIIVTILSAGIMLGRALFISPYPDPLLRMMVFVIIAGMLGYLTGRSRQEIKQRRRLEAQLISQKDTLLAIWERMEDGILIIGPDYRIRFMNATMVRDFGKGTGSHCHELLRRFDYPCQQVCKLPSVIGGAIEKWAYTFPDGRSYEITASPYIDSDGTICQLARFRNTTQPKG